MSKLVLCCKNVKNLKKCGLKWIPRIQSLAAKIILRIGEACNGLNYATKAFIMLISDSPNLWRTGKNQYVFEVDHAVTSSLTVSKDLIALAISVYSLENCNGHQIILNKTVSTLFFILEDLQVKGTIETESEEPRYPIGGNLSTYENFRKFSSMLLVLLELPVEFLEVLNLKNLVSQLYSLSVPNHSLSDEIFSFGDTLFSNLVKAYS